MPVQQTQVARESATATAGDIVEYPKTQAIIS